jgi:hypothetical protein
VISPLTRACGAHPGGRARRLDDPHRCENSISGLARIVRASPRFWLQIPTSGLRLARVSSPTPLTHYPLTTVYRSIATQSPTHESRQRSQPRTRCLLRSVAGLQRRRAARRPGREWGGQGPAGARPAAVGGCVQNPAGGGELQGAGRSAPRCWTPGRRGPARPSRVATPPPPPPRAPIEFW